MTERTWSSGLSPPPPQAARNRTVPATSSGRSARMRANYYSGERRRAPIGALRNEYRSVSLLGVGLRHRRGVEGALVGLALGLGVAAHGHRLLLALGGLRDLQQHVAVVTLRGALDQHGPALLGERLLEDEVRQRVLDVALDRAAQRPGAHGRVPALLDQEVLRRLLELQLQLALGQRGADAQEQQVDDLLDLDLRELVEDDDLVDPVQELRAEHLAEL